MIDLRDVRKALRGALTEAGYNYAAGGDIVPNSASVDPFVTRYHENIGGVTDLVSASTVVKLTTDRADEESAMERLDDVMSSIPVVIEDAPGPWHLVMVVSGQVASPVQVGESYYASAEFVVQFYV
jgi:hypothetical protein